MKRHGAAGDQLRRRLAGRAVVVVSPHLDDAALSAWWLLTQLDDVTVLSVCTAPAADGAASYWDVKDGFASSVEACDVRRDEDSRALGRTNARSCQLGLREVSYRSDAEEAAFPDAVREAVTAAVADLQAVTLVLPAALGRQVGRLRRVRQRSRIPGFRTATGAKQHPDHRAVRDALLELVLRPGDEVAVYEDIPYARSGGHDLLGQRLAAAHLETRRVVVPVDLDAKERVLREYTSQYASFLPAWGRTLSDGFDAVERYWWPVA